MSRHSHWAKVKHEKGATDARKGALFSKMIRAVTIAAQSGGDPASNFKLRMAAEAARAAGVTKDTIERAVLRGTGADKAGVQMEEITYEAIGPGGVGLLIEVVTDNKNRAMGEVKRILGDYEAALAGAGSVAWQFARKGIIRFPLPAGEGGGGGEKISEDIQLALIDAGTEDIREEDGGVTLVTAPEKLQSVSDAARAAGLTVEYAGLEWLHKESAQISGDLRAKVDALAEALEESEEVNAVYSNAG